MSEPRALVPALATDSCTPIPNERALSGQTIVTRSRADGATSFFDGSSGFEIHNSHFVVDNRTIHYDYRVLPPAGLAEVDKVLKLIPTSNFGAIQDENMAKRTPETGRVIIESAFFQQWLSNQQTEVWILWGIGIPGAGKTLLAALVIETLQRSARDNPKISVAYAYFRYTERPSLVDILTALVRQQVESHHNLAPLVEPLFAQKKRENRQPSEDDLVSLLQSISRHFDQTFYSLDGLDEAPREMYIKIVRTVLKIKSVKLWMTSRPLKDIQDAISNVHLFTIEANEADIRKYVEEQLGYEPGLAKLVDRYGCEDFIRTIQTKAGGMFLHATLQMNALKDALNLRTIQKQLDITPYDIEPLYVNTLARINNHPNGKAVVKLALTLLVFGSTTIKTPLTLTDLQWALAFDEETQQFDHELLIPEDRLLPLFCGLITVESTNVVRLVHYTAQDILRPILAQEFRLPQLTILKLCIARLRQFGVHDNGSRESLLDDVVQEPLLSHSYETWVSLAQDVLADTTGRDTALEFVLQCSAYPLLHFNWLHKSYMLRDVLSPAHIAATYNLTNALRRIYGPSLSNDVNAPSKERMRSPLMYACEEGHEEAVEFLLTIPGVDVNLGDVEKNTPLTLAVNNGQGRVVRRLLAARGIHTEAEYLTRDLQTPLMLAARRGDLDIVRMLLNTRGVDADCLDWKGRTALMRAATGGHKDVVQLLLDARGVKVDRVDGDGWSALMRAAFFRSHDVLRLLLNTPGVNPNRVNAAGDSSLTIAAKNGREESVRILLDAQKIKTNYATKEGHTAAMLAALHGEVACVQLLSRDRRVQLDRVDIHGQSALMLAAKNCYKDVVRCLLESGKVDVQRVDFNGRTASMLAAERGRHDIVKLITDYSASKAEVDADDQPSPASPPPFLDDDHDDASSTESDADIPVWATFTPWPTMDDSEFVPGERDVFKMHRMLLSKLPRALVERILDEAEYWPQLFAQKESTPPTQVIASDSADSPTSCCYFISPKLPEYCLVEETKAHVRRVIFHIWSHDQGENSVIGVHSDSFTWFEAAILRGTSGEDSKNPETLARLVQGPSCEGHPEKADSHPWTKEKVWHLQRNRRAFDEEDYHEIVWDVGPELAQPSTVDGDALTRSSGAGQGFVRELRAGDQIAIFAKAQYPGWVNHVAGAAVQVYYSPFKLPEPAIPDCPQKLDHFVKERAVTTQQNQPDPPSRSALNLLAYSLIYAFGTYLSIDPRSILQ